MINAKKPDFIDPDDLCFKQMSATRRQVLDGIDYRMKTLEESEDRFKEERIAELEMVRRFVKNVMYKKDSYKELL